MNEINVFLNLFLFIKSWASLAGMALAPISIQHWQDSNLMLIEDNFN